MPVAGNEMRPQMRRFISLLCVVALFMVSMAVSISAQDTSPQAGPVELPESFEIAPGVVADNMVFAEGAEAPSMYRLTFDSGVVYEVMPGPVLEVIYLESGSLVITLDASVTVMQLGDVEGGGEMFSAGTEIMLEAGDFFVIQPGVGGEVRNESSDPAVASVARLMPAEPGAPNGSLEATPDASPEG